MAKDDLSSEVAEILEYLEKQGFNIFYAEADPHRDASFEWDHEQDWKHFFEVAKKEGVATIVASILTLKKATVDQFKATLESLKAQEDDETSDELTEATELLRTLSKHQDETGFYDFLWAKNGLEYSLRASADWFEDMVSLLEAGKNRMGQARREIVVPRFGPSGSNMENAIPEALKGKNDTALTKELVEYVLAESDGKPRIRDFRNLSYMFWAKIGVRRFMLPAEQMYLVQKSETMAEKQIGQMQLERDKKELPKLVDECYDWCRENSLTKLIKTNVSAFLTEREIELSRNAEDMLYQQVNMKLRADR